MSSVAGLNIKGYALQDQIGEGGFGAIYRGRQLSVDREIAIKVILPEYANRPDFIRRFETEAQLVARLEHPHIVPLIDYWRDPEGAYLVMRYLRAGSVYGRLRNNGAFSPEATLKLVEQVASALSLAHRNHIIHRDIKPDNILMDDDGNAYLTDFGIAKANTQDEEDEDSITGSPGYIAPEQITAGEIGAHTDLYSFGIVIYEVLTNHHPFAGQSASEMFLKHLQGNILEIPAGSPLSPKVQAFIRRATARLPADRFPDAAAMAVSFREALSAEKPIETGFAVVDFSAITNPYKGLRAFDEADADDFFGRETLVQYLIQRLDGEEQFGNFLAVVGPSGSGKSSAVKAGVVPALRKGALPGSEKWFYAELTPGIDPYQNLETALLSVAINPPADLGATLRRDENGLGEAIKAILPANEHLFLLIDQFEEVFTLLADEATRVRFLDALSNAVQDAAIKSRLHLVVTLRADFYDRPLLYETFATLIRNRTEVVIPLTTQELEAAIIRPAERAGLKVAPNLVSDIINDVREEPGTLPLLQYALTELFERRTGNMLKPESYQNIGRVNGAVARRADELYNALTPAQKSVARQVFLRLVTLGEGVEDTRRRALRSELAAVAKDADALQTILDQYGKFRLFTFDHDAQTREPTVEVAHEALIREWAQLREWLDASRGDVRTQRQVSAAANEWQTARRDASFLLRGSRLTQFDEWAKTTDLALTPFEQEYLQASLQERQVQEAAEAERRTREQKLERRARQTLRGLVGVMAVAVVVALGLTAFAFSRSQAEQQARTVAEERAAEVASLALASAGQQALNENDLDLSVALALEANKTIAPPSESRRMLLQVASLPGTNQLLRHRNPLWAVALSPDAKLIASGGGPTTPASNLYQGRPTFLPLNSAPPGAGGPPPDYAITLWDRTAGKEIARLEGHTNTITDLAFAPDGKTLYSAAADGSVRVWDIASGKETRQVIKAGAQVLAIALSPDGSSILVSTFDLETNKNSLTLLNNQSGEEIRRFGGSRDVFASIAFSPDGKLILAAPAPSSPAAPLMDAPDIIQWDAQTGNEVRRLRGHQGGVFSVAYSPDGKYALSGGVDGAVIYWSLETGEIVRRLPAPYDRFAYRVAISPDGRFGLSYGFESFFILWDLNSGAELSRFLYPQAPITDIAFAPDGRSVITAGSDAVARDWDLFSRDEVRRMFAPAGTGQWALAISPDGKTAVSASGTPNWYRPYFGANLLHVWDIATGKEIRTLQGAKSTINMAAFLPDGKRLLTVSGNTFGPGENVMLMWDMETGEIIRRYESPMTALTGLAITRDGKQALTLAFGVALILWDLESGRPVNVFQGTMPFSQVALSPDGKFAVSGEGNGVVTRWDMATGQPVQKYEGVHRFFIQDVVYSSDGTFFVTGGADDLIVVWDVASSQPKGLYNLARSSIRSLALSPDDKLLLIGTAGADLFLLDLAAGELVGTYNGYRSQVWQTRFTPDGKHGLATSWDGNLIMWRIEPQLLPELKAWTQENRFTRAFNCEERRRFRLVPCTPEEAAAARSGPPGAPPPNAQGTPPR
jgi:WD40 repeat protein